MKSERLIGLPRWLKQAVVMAVDLSLGVAATWLAFSLRIDGMHVPHGNEWIPYWFGPLLALPIFIHFGLYRAIFRYTDLAAIKQILKAVAVYAAIYTAVVLAFYIPPNPRSIGVLQPFILSAFIVGVRMFARFWLLSSTIDPRLRVLRRRLLIVGAGEEAVQLASALKGSPEYIQIGFVSNDSQLVGRNMAGHRVFALGELRKVIENYEVSDLVIALGSGSQGARRQIIEECKGLPVHIQTAGLTLDSQHSSIRELDIDDLLGRDHVPANVELLNLKNHNKVVLVTGAGGSIGSELCRQIIRNQPKMLILYELTEFALYDVEKELRLTATCEIIPILGTVQDQQKLERIIEQYHVQTVYHAAAYKHVPLVECNPIAGLKNNSIGTANSLNAAVKKGVETFVLISTDKAVRPTNVMGASKRMAELYCQAVAETKPKTQISIVRFGNVLGSSGSVVPLFRQQIAKGGPITVTHPDVTRYFMTIPEASQLVIQAGALGSGGDVFLLDMGEPVRIQDLARQMITLSGLKVREPNTIEGDIEIAYSGLRPGEKLYEELLIDQENTGYTEHTRILRSFEKHYPLQEIQSVFSRINQMTAVADDVDWALSQLEHYVDGYKRSGEVRVN